MTVIAGNDIIAIPMGYHDEFRRDSIDSLLKYGSLPQRARSPWFTDVQAIKKALCLPDQVRGPGAQHLNPKAPALSIVADKDPETLLNGIAPTFGASDPGYWHVHIDLALNKKRHGDAAGIAMGRIGQEWIESYHDPINGSYRRTVRNYEIPLVAQIIAPPGGQVYITSVVKFVLMLKQVRGFNITSYSFDGWQSADASQQLMLAGLVTKGMQINDETGTVEGLPQPFSVDGSSTQPYRELLEGVNDDRVQMPDYGWLERELKQLETVGPGQAPDHPVGGSKDVADPCAGVVGYLAAYGHAILFDPGDFRFDRPALEEQGVLEPVASGFNVEDQGSSFDFGSGLGGGTDFNV